MSLVMHTPQFPPPAFFMETPRAVRVAEAASFSHVGLRRSNNEDRVLEVPEFQVYAVADGVGGHEAGEVAAEIAVETLRECAGGWLDLEPGLDAKHSALLLAMHFANAQAWITGESDPRRQGMATTLDAVTFVDNAMIVAHVGDSRVYVLRDGDLYLVTQDHEEEFTFDGETRHGLTRAIGFDREVEVDVKVKEVRSGDVVLLCTDGLHGVVPAYLIERELNERSSAAEIAERLVDLALKYGGPDNVSGVVLRLE